LDFSYDSSYGTIHSEWSIKGNIAIWNLTIPANATGRLPLSQNQTQSFKLDGKLLSENKNVHPLGSNGSPLEYELPAGSYRFEVTLP